jgi:hypothetical protein
VVGENNLNFNLPDLKEEFSRFEWIVKLSFAIGEYGLDFVLLRVLIGIESPHDNAS